MNKMKDEGYTEAERAAAEWRRQQKLTKVNSSADNRRNMNNNRRNEDRYDSDRNQRHRRSNSRTREIKMVVVSRVGAKSLPVLSN